MGLFVGQFAPVGTWSVPRVAGVGTTPFVQEIPPLGGAGGGPPMLYRPGLVPAVTASMMGKFFTHVAKVCYTTGLTAQSIQILRPLNFTWLTANVAKGATVLPLFDDPGLFSTKYKYLTPNGVPPAQVPDNSIGAATTPFVMLQLADGTWFATAATALAGLNLTVGALPSPTGAGGALQFAPVYYFVPGLTQLDPATSNPSPSTQIAASQVRDVSWGESGSGAGFGICESLHPGDPLLFYSPNTGNAGSLEYMSGYYANL